MPETGGGCCAGFINVEGRDPYILQVENDVCPICGDKGFFSAYFTREPWFGVVKGKDIVEPVPLFF